MLVTVILAPGEPDANGWRRSGNDARRTGPMKRAADTTVLTSPDYREFIEDLKTRVNAARLSAARAANQELILLYWDIGRGIAEKQSQHGWGDSVVRMISADLRRAFPGTRGFSVQNVWRMKQFYVTHAAKEFLSHVVREMAGGASESTSEKLSQLVRELVARVPWGHHANVLARNTSSTCCSTTASSRRWWPSI